MKKEMYKKILKSFLLTIIIIAIFVMTFIFINKKINSNSEIENIVSFNNPKTEIKETTPTTSSTTVTFPYYYGIGDKGLTPLQVSMLTKDFKENTSPFTVSVSPAGQVWYFAYPDSYPALRSIKDQNGFELIYDFKVTTGNIIKNSSGKKMTYRIYEYNNVTTLSSYKVTYIE